MSVSLALVKVLESQGSDLNHFLSTLPATLGFRIEIIIGTAGTANGKIEYVGFAPSDSLLSQPVWKIIKLVYDASGNIIRVLHANGDTKFVNVFNSGASEYAGYTYTES